MHWREKLSLRILSKGTSCTGSRVPPFLQEASVDNYKINSLTLLLFKILCLHHSAFFSLAFITPKVWDIFPVRSRGSMRFLYRALRWLELGRPIPQKLHIGVYPSVRISVRWFHGKRLTWLVVILFAHCWATILAAWLKG